MKPSTTFIPTTRFPRASRPTAAAIIAVAAVMALAIIANATPASADTAGDRNGQSPTAAPEKTPLEKQKPADPPKPGESGKGRAGGTEDPGQDPSQPQPAVPPPATTPETTPPTPATPPAPDQAEDDDMSIDPLQPDFTIVTLPTTLRMPKYKGAFRVTHRFSRGVGTGDIGDLFENFFGFDSSSGIALEFRFGLAPGLQASVHRTNGKVIQLLAQYNAVKQDVGRPIGLDVLVSVEGRRNLTEDHSAAIGLVLSRTLGSVGSIYLEPIFVTNTPRIANDLSSDDHTLLLGIGTRLRVRPTVAVVGEVIPRVAGYSPRDHQWAIGIEKRVGGHSFQVNVGNSFWTTFGQIASGGITKNRETGDNWLIGFNISRKFF